MKTFDWPEGLIPFRQSYYLQGHSGGAESPFTRQTKTYDLGARRWVTTLEFRGGYNGDWANDYGPRLDGFISQLNGRVNRVRIPDFRRKELHHGANPASLSNSGAAAGATSMSVSGFGSFAPAFFPGDYIGGDGRAHIVTEESFADGMGNAVAVFDPPLGADVLTGKAEFGQDVTSVFMLTSDDAGSNSTEVGDLTNYVLEFVEDMQPPYNPAAIFEDATDGFWYDLADISKLYTNASRTTPITAFGQAINGITDKSPFNRHAGGPGGTSRPIFSTHDNTVNGLRGARWDGVNDYLTTPATILGANGGTLVMAVQIPAHVSGMLYSQASGAANPYFSLSTGPAEQGSNIQFKGNNTAELRAAMRNDAATSAVIDSTEIFADQNNRIVTLRISPSGANRLIEMWIDNRKQPVSVVSSGAITLTNAAIGALLLSGAPTLFLKGVIFEMLGVNTALSDAEILNVQKYLAGKHYHPGLRAEGVNTIIQYPRLTVFKGNLMAGTTTAAGGVRVTELTLDADKFRGPAFSSRSWNNDDSHFGPAVHTTADGRLALLGVRHDFAQLSVAVSQPGNITEEWPINRIDTLLTPNVGSYGYPRIFERNGEYQVFLRGFLAPETATQKGLWVASTTDLAVAFDGAVKLLSGNRPYATVWEHPTNRDRIDMLVSTGNPDDAGHTDDLYHCYYLFSTKRLYTTNGTLVALAAPVTDLTELHSQTATGLESWVAGPPWIGADGHPRAAYIVYNADGSQSFMFRRWTGSEWTAPVLLKWSAGPTLDVAVAARNYIANGNFYPDPRNPRVVFVGANEGAPGTNGVVNPHQIWRMVSSNNGAVWTGTKLTDEEFFCANPAVSPVAREPRLTYETGPFVISSSFEDVFTKLVDSQTGEWL